MATTAERLLMAMELRNMKQSELIAKTGINKGSLSCYISGKYIPKQGNTYLMAKALNVSESWLMGLDVPMERKETVEPSMPENTEEKEMLTLFQHSTPEMRKAALAVLKAGQPSSLPQESHHDRDEGTEPHRSREV